MAKLPPTKAITMAFMVLFFILAALISGTGCGGTPTPWDTCTERWDVCVDRFGPQADTCSVSWAKCVATATSTVVE